MALLRTHELRDMNPEMREQRLRELRDELMHERGIGAMGGAPASPGKIRALRKNIARILTIQKEVAAKDITKEATLSSNNKKKETTPSSNKEKKEAES